MIAEVERARDAALTDIEAVYGPFLAPLAELRKELAERTALAELTPPKDKESLKKFREAKKANFERLKLVKAQVKDLTKLEDEAEAKRTDARKAAEREIALVRDTAADMLRICGDPKESARYFVAIERPEIVENEFNLNVPRYVDTFEPEEKIEIVNALEEFDNASRFFLQKRRELRCLLKANGKTAIPD